MKLTTGKAVSVGPVSKAYLQINTTCGASKIDQLNPKEVAYSKQDW